MVIKYEKHHPCVLIRDLESLVHPLINTDSSQITTSTRMADLSTKADTLFNVGGLVAVVTGGGSGTFFDTTCDTLQDSDGVI